MKFRTNSLVDMLDRILDRGLFVDADLVIVVANIPLIAARLKAVVSSVETMLAHGMMEDSSRVRAIASGLSSKEKKVEPTHRH